MSAAAAAAPIDAPRDPGPGRRAQLIAFGVAAAVALGAFLWRLLPGVGFWDTAVFQAAAPTGGLVHPTGYPTFLMLGFAWVHLLPFLEPATALNAMTAVAGALAVGAIGLLAVRLGAKPWAAVAGAFTVGLTTEFWATSARADPHPLHVLFALSIVLLLLRWDDLAVLGAPGADRWLALAALVFGISMGNHSLTVMLAPGIGIFVLTARPSLLRRPRSVAIAVVALATGLLVYLYVPLRAAANPTIHHDYAPTTLGLFWRYVTGADFTGSMAFLTADGPGVAARALPDFVGHVSDWLTPTGAQALAFFAIVGGLLLLRSQAFRALWLILATAGLTLYARLTYSNGDLERYALYPLAVAGALAAIGLSGTIESVVEALADLWRPARALAGAVTLAVAISIPAALLPLNAAKAGNMEASCYVDAMMAQLPDRAWVISWWSYMTPLWYAQAVQGRRPDVGLVLAGSDAAAQAAARWGDGRPIWLIEFDSDIQAARNLGFTLEKSSACGRDVWVVTGRTSAP
jgi:hypothetical protein